MRYFGRFGKAIAVLLAVALLAGALCSCDYIKKIGEYAQKVTAGIQRGAGEGEGYPDNGVQEAEELSDGRLVNGYVEAIVGQKVSVYWFDFTVTSVTFADTYAEQTAGADMVFAVVRLKLQNTWSDALEMDRDEFGLLYGKAGEENYQDSAEPHVGNSRKLYPQTFKLEKDEEKEAELIYLVPADAEDFAFWFVEYYEDDISGNSFYVDFNRNVA